MPPRVRARASSAVSLQVRSQSSASTLATQVFALRAFALRALHSSDAAIASGFADRAFARLESWAVPLAAMPQAASALMLVLALKPVAEAVAWRRLR